MLLPEASFFRLRLRCVHIRITLGPIHHLISWLSFETASLTLGPFLYLVAVVHLLSSFWFFSTPWTAAHQASLSFTISQSLLKLMSIESVIPSNHLILCRSLLLPSIFPASGSFLVSQFFASGGQSIGVSASASVLPMNIQDWFPLGWTGWISLQSKGLSSLLQQHSSKASIRWCSDFFMVQLSHPYVTTGNTIALDYMNLCRQSNVSAF